jgi:hypothetical protein
MVFYNEPLERVKLHVFCMNFTMGFVYAILQDKSQQNFFTSRLLLAHPLQGCLDDYYRSCDVCQTYV